MILCSFKDAANFIHIPCKSFIITMRNVLIRSGAKDYKIITLMRHTPKNIPKSIQIISIKIFPFHLNTHFFIQFHYIAAFSEI